MPVSRVCLCTELVLSPKHDVGKRVVKAGVGMGKQRGRWDKEVRTELTQGEALFLSSQGPVFCLHR